MYLGAGPFYLEKCSAAPLKESVRGLLGERIDMIAGAHGDPVTGDAKEMLRRLLDVGWEPLLKEQQFPVAR